MRKDISYRIKYFYDLFLKKKITFSKKDFFFNLNTRKKNIEIDRKLYKDIVLTFFDVYFKELYFTNMPKYFFLGGKILKARGPRSYFQNSNHKKAILSNSIVLLWYLRPDMSFFTSVCLLKLTGKGNRIPELDNLYRNNRDMNLLPDIYQKISEFISTKQIAR